MCRCVKCDSERIVNILAKCSDLCYTTLPSGREHDGYVPDCNVGGGDYVDFSYCQDCGTIQSDWPEKDIEFEDSSFGEEEEIE